MKAGSSVLQRVRSPGMITALAKQHAAMAIEISKQLAPLHTDKISSSKPLSAAARASAVEFQRFGQYHAKARQQLLAGPFLGVDARDLFDPADPPISVLFNNRCV